MVLDAHLPVTPLGDVLQAVLEVLRNPFRHALLKLLRRNCVHPTAKSTQDTDKLDRSR
jgi:hypothetical protein